MRPFLESCRERRLVLNPEKIRFRQREVSYMGCLLTDKGIKTDPKKISAALQMPMRTDVQGVRRMLGAVQYLIKFVKGLRDLTTHLRELLHKDN